MLRQRTIKAGKPLSLNSSKTGSSKGFKNSQSRIHACITASSALARTEPSIGVVVSTHTRAIRKLFFTSNLIRRSRLAMDRSHIDRCRRRTAGWARTGRTDPNGQGLVSPMNGFLLWPTKAGQYRKPCR